MVRSKNRQKKPITHKVSNYIKSILTEEYKKIRSIYIQNHDPFYGWVVGNLVEISIKDFVCKNFMHGEQKRVSESKSTNNQMEFSLLLNAIKKLQSNNKVDDTSFDEEEPLEFVEHILPANPEEFSRNDWFVIRKYYDYKKKEQNKEYVKDLAGVVPLNGNGDNPPIGQESKFDGIREKINYQQERESKDDEFPGKEKPDYGKQRGTTSLEAYHIDKNVDNEEIFVNERIDGKDSFNAERYLSMVRNEILDEMEPIMEPDILKVVFKDKDSFTLQLIFSKRGDLNSTFTLMQEKLQQELDEYLWSKYNDVSSQLMSRNIDGIDFVIYLAGFSLDAVRKSKSEELFFIRNDNIYLDLES